MKLKIKTLGKLYSHSKKKKALSKLHLLNYSFRNLGIGGDTWKSWTFGTESLAVFNSYFHI